MSARLNAGHKNSDRGQHRCNQNKSESAVILDSVFFEDSFTHHLHHGLVNILNQ